MRSTLIKLFLFNSLIIFSLSGITQNDSLKIDPLKKILVTEKEDTNKVNAFLQLCDIQGRPDSAIFYANQALLLSQKINYQKGEAEQHSRSSVNVKELTDINALADEYLRLSYHGLRAKDNSFNATMKTDLDDTIGKINIISSPPNQQDKELASV
jgi:hypothetical protein